LSGFWAWRNFKLILPGFLIFRIYTGLDSIVLELKVKEQAGERQSLELTYNSQTFGEFIESLKGINGRVIKKDFGSKSLKYDFSSENKAELNFYFNKNEWIKFYQFLENCYKEIQEQELAYKKISEERSIKL